MEKQVEFFVSPQGEVCFYGHDGKVLCYSTEHPEIINHMAELISRLYRRRISTWQTYTPRVSQTNFISSFS